VDPDDRQLFRRWMSGVRPLAQKRAPGRPPAPAPRPRQGEADDRAVTRAMLAATPAELEAAGGGALSFSVPGIQHSVLRRLRRGEYRVQGEIDLHGLTAQEARARLADFLHGARRRRWRCVRVVHGKGLGSPGGRPVLKAWVNLWLRRRREVLAFCSAPAWDGGTGALYILLRRA